MSNSAHPDDDRLAALAEADPDATSDPALAAHVAACDRCGPLVAELGLLRSALAALPDIAPPRPLRLIPPVPEPAARRSGALVWLRRLAAPAMVAGAGIALVGAVGLAGLGAGTAALAAPSADFEAASGSPRAPALGGGAPSPVPVAAGEGSKDTSHSGAPRTQTDAGRQSAAPTASSEGKGVHGLETPSPSQLSLTLLIAGAALFGISAGLFFSLRARAG